ncbi:MAG: peptide chain release factor 1 [Sporolactobacillus sp.]|jgi:peptide chain release factor 1|nr:peptide chain release factor 1 [Sporolactobacillus sp.]MCI1881145.1 peptide chain release factor 1 [Sporolactobacillus sp.]
MFERLQGIEERYEKLNQLLADPAVIRDPAKLRDYSKEQSDLQEIVSVYRHYHRAEKELADARLMLKDSSDAGLDEMVRDEIDRLEQERGADARRLKQLLLPKDPKDERNVIVEIRGAAGGDEAALFAGDLFRMYSKYAESRGWKTEVVDASPNEIGGYKEIVFMISGHGAYSRLKYESGTHRVQRVPKTESSGKTHTSTATVAVLPEAKAVDVKLNDKDIRVDRFASSGPGGQSVNTTMSAVRLTHVPTGIVVTCQEERSQIKNKEKAMKVLRARVYDKYRKEAQEKYDSTRKSAIGTGDRSERVRTYNFSQNRVTDHRIGLTVHQLDQVLAGKLDEIIDALILNDQAKKMEQADI